MWNVGSVMGDELLLDHLTTCNVPWQGAVAASFVDKEVHRWTSLKNLLLERTKVNKTNSKYFLSKLLFCYTVYILNSRLTRDHK